jgi:hypothetical protein
MAARSSFAFQSVVSIPAFHRIETKKHARSTMRKSVLGLSIYCLLAGLTSICVSAQTAPPVEDPQAVTVLTASLTAMGGQALFSSIQDSTISGQMQSVDGQQPPDQFVWKSLGIAIRHEYAMADGLHISVVNQDKGQLKDPDGTVTALNARSSLTILPYHMPGVLLLSLLTSQNVSLALVAQPSSDPQYIHVSAQQQLQDPKLSYLTQQEWEFDPATGLPVKVTFCLPDERNQGHVGQASIAYTAWQNASGALFPQAFELFTDGELQSTITLQTPAFNQGLRASDFQLQ